MLLFSHEPLLGEIDGKNRLFELKSKPVLPGSLHLFEGEENRRGLILLEPGRDYTMSGEFVIVNPSPKQGIRLIATYLVYETGKK